jgi:acyl carrier protein
MEDSIQTLIQALNEFICARILKQPRRRLSPDEALISSGLVDSFSLVDLQLFIESTFGVLLHDTELNKETFDTLAQLARLVDSRR